MSANLKIRQKSNLHFFFSIGNKHIFRGSCDIRPSDLETLAADRAGWRVLYKDGIKRAEYDRIDHLVTRRERRHIRAGRIQSHQPA